MISIKVIEVKGTSTITGIMDAIRNDPDFKAFNQRARDYYKWVHDDALVGLSESDAAIFEAWWSGKCVDNGPVPCPTKAKSAILYAISCGCG